MSHSSQTIWADYSLAVGNSNAKMADTAREFTHLYHDLRDQTLGRTRWLGRTVVKSPADLGSTLASRLK